MQLQTLSARASKVSKRCRSHEAEIGRGAHSVGRVDAHNWSSHQRNGARHLVAVPIQLVIRLVPALTQNWILFKAPTLSSFEKTGEDSVT